ncbi:peptidylarginine deiminase-like enzyme [Desulfosporosinus orientis DSM 765]|uniref:Peptidylarginine deiminase-like enzyme n=1 Tax=Desulfosporosinus orientis (strain ATCC 19365 / DSM 765 / NCIMB 8382 / VKM B-1628 / Singapore I) TaxID=768706 RepID=G7WFU4_DESOD|nr:agmatine deiminase family protein [Desulfosporosinus orientis]AET69459.1 peptidylarginine deiminase-like enzyme [Desulfosporosinus orientis DSM 765]
MYPINLNYRMPPEWARHIRTYISWPIKASMCFPEDYEAVCQGYAEIIRAIAEFEPVTIVANSADFQKISALVHRNNIEVLRIEHNDAWLRDNGPTFLIHDDGTLAGVNWQFNAWGGKYTPWDLDNQVAGEILTHVGLKQFDAPLVMEGGSFHVDGEGTLLTTEQCLLNPNRNPGMSREQIEAELKRFLHIQKIVWLNKGLAGDETDGHVDNIACFAAPGKILLQVCDDPQDENYWITQENLTILKRERDACQRSFEIIPIQQPPQRMDLVTNKRLTLSYLNFYFVNGGIVLPVFGGEAKEYDQSAVNVLSATFPNRRIRTVKGMGIIREGGNVHCTTQQMPEGRN